MTCNDINDINDMMEIDNEYIINEEELKRHKRLVNNRLYYERTKIERRKKYELVKDSINAKYNEKYKNDEDFRKKKAMKLAELYRAKKSLKETNRCNN